MQLGNLNKQIYIVDYRESMCNSWITFLSNKSLTYQIDCILQCYLEFTFTDWQQIILTEAYKYVIQEKEELKVVELICQSFELNKNLLDDLMESQIYRINSIDDSVAYIKAELEMLNTRLNYIDEKVNNN